MYGSSWDDGYMQRYPKEQYGHGVPNIYGDDLLPTGRTSFDAAASIRPDSLAARTTEIGSNTFYDSGTIGAGLRSFVKDAPAGSMKAALYEYGSSADMLREMNRALENKGALVSGGANLQFDLGDSFRGILGAVRDLSWDKVSKQVDYLTRSATAYSTHIAHTGADPFVDAAVPLGVASIGGAVVGAALGKVVGRVGMGALLGAGLGAALTSAYSMLRYQEPLLKMSNVGVSGVYTADKVGSVLTGGKYIPGEQGLTHIHSKALWTKDEVFISTGNLQTVWEGDESQFNLAVKVGGAQGRALASQLDKLHSFLKTVRKDSDLSAIAEQTPDLILGGKGSKSKEKIVSFLREAKGDVWISAPYVSNSKESRLIIDTIKDLEKRGHNVHILAQNPSGINAGGNADASKQVLAELKAAGVQIYMTPQDSNTLEHAKLIADDNRVLLTSHNLLSGNSINNVIEVGTILRGKEYADAVRAAIGRRIATVGAKDLDTSRFLNPEIYDSAKAQQIASRLGARGFEPLVGQGTGMLLPASMGGSYFYARAQYNALMRQAGLTENVVDSDDASLATSMYEVGYLAKHGRPPDSLPVGIGSSVIGGAIVGSLVGVLTGKVRGLLGGAVVGGLLGLGVGASSSYVSRYDRELTAGGMGTVINEWGAANDWGRLYKEEVGFLPSLMGVIGRVLDRTYLYSSPGGALWADREDDGQVVGKDGMKYPSGGKGGFFETFLSKGTEIGLGAISSVALYLALGEPTNILLGEMVKGEVESLINVGASPTAFRDSWVQGLFSRQLTTGMGWQAKDVTGYREQLLREVATTTREDYEALEEARKLVDYLSTTRKVVSSTGVVTIKHDPATTAGRQALEQAIVDLQRVEAGYGTKGYYSIDRMGASVYHVASLTRERAGTLVENTLKPFILEYVDPYAEGTEGARSLRRGLVNVISEIRRPAFLDVEVNDSSNRAIAFIREVSQREQQILKANPQTVSAWEVARGEVLSGGKYSAIDDDIANVSFRLQNVGKDRASRVASAIQDVLDIVPLPLTQWRAFSKHVGGGITNPKDVKVLGDIFSFEEVTNSIGRALQGTGGLSEYIQEYRALSGVAGPDVGLLDALTAGPGRFLRYIRDKHDAVKSLEASSRAVSKMERTLFASGDIRWGHELPPSTIEQVEDDIIRGMKAMNPALDLASPKVQAEIYSATQAKLAPLVDPLVREISKVDDVLLDVLTMPGVEGTLGSKAMSVLGETLRARQHSSYMSGTSRRKLERLRSGWGADATSGTTKGKLGTAAVTVLALSLFAEKLFRTTDGVSLFTQLGTALGMRNEGIQVSTEFKGDALLPTVAGVPLDYLVSAGLIVPARYVTDALQGQRVLSYAMRRDTVAQAVGVTRIELDAALAGTASHPRIGALAGGMAEVELFPGVRSTLHMGGLGDEFMRFSMAALEGNRWRNTAAAWAIGLLTYTVATKGIAAALNTSRSITSSGNLDPLVLGAAGAVGLGGLLARTTGKGVLAGVLAGGIGGALLGSMTSGMREGREGTLDPIALGLAGVVVGKAVGGKGRGGLVGALIGGGLGLVAGMFTSFLRVGRDDWQAVNKKEATILADMTTYVQRVKDRAQAGDASRLELMGAYYAMGWSKTLRATEDRQQGKNVQVVARQAVLPFLQVFMAETIKGATYNKDGSMRTLGTSYYSVGIQGPIVTGVSVPIQLPFKLTRDGRGTLGLAMNEDDNVGTFMGDVVSVRTAILTTLTTLGAITGTANALQAGIRSVSTRTPFVSNLLDNGWSKGVRGVVDALTETALILPSSALRITMAMSGADYMVAGRAFTPPMPSTSRLPTPLTDPSLYGRHIGRALVWGVLGAAIGSTVGGVISSNPDDPLASQVGAGTGGAIGAALGTGLYMAAALTKETGLGASVISRMGRSKVPLPNTIKKVLGRGGPVLALMAALGTLFTSSTFGVSVGLDKPRSWLGYQEPGKDAYNKESTRMLGGEYFPSWVPLIGYRPPTPTANGMPSLEAGGWTYQRAMTVGLYATTTTAVMSLYGGMGKSVGDTVDEYMRLVRRRRPTPTDNVVLQAVDRFRGWRAAHLEKDIDTILRRGYDMGGDALTGNLQQLHEASRVLYENKVYKALDITPHMTPAVDEALEKVIQRGHGLGVSMKFIPDLLPRRAMRGATFLGAVVLGVGLVASSMGADTIDRIYDHLDAGNGLMRSMADAMRLMTGTDRSIEEDAVLAKQYVKEGGFPTLLNRRKLLAKTKDVGQAASSLWSQMSQLMVFDAPNAFVGVQVLGGVTLRRGEYGDRMTPYLQVQGAGADLSTATYTMAASFLFNSIGSSQDLHFNMVNAMRELHTLTREGVPITQAHLRRAAIGMLSYTAKMQPLTKARKYSPPTSAVLSAASKDPLLALALSHRQAVTRQMAYQPPESLISAMLKENMNPAYREVDGNLMAAVLQGMQLTGGALGGMMNEVRIHGIKAFSVKKDGLNAREMAVQEGEWLEDTTPVDSDRDSSSPISTAARMLLGIFPTPIAYAVGLTAVGAVGMFAAASIGGFFLNREVNAIEAALNKHYSRPWYVKHPHRISAVKSPPGTALTPRSLYALNEGTHGTMYSINPRLVDEVRAVSPNGVHKLVELAQDAINLSLTSNGVLFGDYMRSQPYLQQVAQAVGPLQGKAARVERLVDEISTPLMGVVDRYFTALEGASINLPGLVTKGGSVIERRVPFLSLFTGASMDEVIADTNSWGKVYGEGFQASLRERFADGMQPYSKLLQVDGTEVLDLVGTYKDEIRKVIRDAVEEHAGKGGSLTKLSWGSVKSDEDGVLHLVQRALDKLRDKSGPLGRMRHEWAGIGTPLPLDVADRFEQLLGASLDMGHSASELDPTRGRRMGPGIETTGKGVGPAMSEMEWSARRARPTNWNKLSKGAGIFMEGLQSIFSLFEASDIWGAYGRAAEAYSKDSTYTTGEQRELAQEAGYVGASSLLNTVVMGAVLYGVGQVISAAGTVVGLASALIAGTASLTFASGAALVALGAAAVAGVGALGYGAVQLFGSQAMKDSVNGWVDGGMNAIGKGVGWASKGFNGLIGKGVDAVGKGIGWASKGVSKTFDWTVDSMAKGVDYVGNRFGSGGVAALGGLLGGLSLGAAVAGLSYVAGSGVVATAGAAVVGAIGLGVGSAALVGGALITGGVALTSALVMGLWGTIDPKGMQRVWSQITGTLSSATKSTPLGEGFLATKRGTWIQSYVNPLGSDSPFFVGTAQQAIEWEYQKVLDLNMDYGGDKVASSFVDPSLYGYSPNAPTNSTLRPDAPIDSMLSSEIKLRGQLHNQTIIGQHVWRSVLSSASNKAVITEQERRHLAASYERVMAVMTPGKVVAGSTLSMREQVDVGAVASIVLGLSEAVKQGTPKGIALKVRLPQPSPNHMQQPVQAPLKQSKATTKPGGKVVVKETHSPLNVYFMQVVSMGVSHPTHSSVA